MSNINMRSGMTRKLYLTPLLVLYWCFTGALLLTAALLQMGMELE
jgi:hypothetical protein